MDDLPRQQERDLMCGLLESQSLAQLQERTEPLLRELFRADHVAFCRMHPELPTGFDWMASTTGHFLQSYYQWYEDDFVFRWLTRHPNTAASDIEMLRGQKVVETETYRRSRESDLHLMRVLAVLLAPQQQLGSGAVALYSERNRAFSVERRRWLQQLTPFLSGAFQNLARFEALSAHNQLLEALLRQKDVTAIVLDAGRREWLRLGDVTPLLERWYPSRSARDEGGIPRAWRARMDAFMTKSALRSPPPQSWREERETKVLEVCLTRLPRIKGRDLWELRLKEFHAIPEAWQQRLSPTQFKAAALIVQGRTNEQISKALGISKNTANEHVDEIYRRLKVSSRAEVIALALRP